MDAAVENNEAERGRKIEKEGTVREESEQTESNSSCLGGCTKADDNTSIPVDIQRMKISKNAKEILEIMESNKMSKIHQIAGCDIIGNMSKIEAFQEIIKVSNGVQVVFQAMEMFPRDVEVQLRGLSALKSIVDPRNTKCDVDVTSHEVRIVLCAMQTFDDDTDVQESGCHVLGSLAWRNERNSDVIGNCGGIQRVVRTMKAFSNSAHLLSRCCYALGLVAYGEKNHRIMQSSDCNTLVLEAMNRFEKNAQVQQWGLLACGNQAYTERNNAFFVLHGGIDVAYRAMDRFENNPEVQRWGVHVLGNLAAVHTTSESIGSSNGIQRIARAMKTNEDNADVQRWGCYALAWLARNEKNRDIIGSSNSIQVVVRAMEKNKENEELQNYGCWALGNFVKDSAANREIVYKECGVASICDAIRTYPKATEGICALRTILDGDAKIQDLRLRLTFLATPPISLSEIDRSDTKEIVRLFGEQRDMFLRIERSVVQNLWFVCFALKCTQNGLYNAHGAPILARTFRFLFRGARRPFPVQDAGVYRAALRREEITE